MLLTRQFLSIIELSLNFLGWMGPNDHLVPTAVQGYHPLHQIAQDPIHPGLGQFHEWDIHSFSWGASLPSK